MKRAIVLAAAAALILTATAAASSPSSGRAMKRFPFGSAAPAQYARGQVLVGLRRHAGRTAVAAAHARVGARVLRSYGSLGVQLVKVPAGTLVADAVRAYRHDPAVAWAEPNYRRYPQVDMFPEEWDLNNTGQLHNVTDVTGDGTANKHAGLNDADIDAPEAWAVEDGSTTHPVVAVIDTGVDVNQVDLNGQLWVNPGEIAGNGLDDDGNGHVDDVNGWDFGNNDATLLSPIHWEGYQHGTHVAGTIAGDNDADGITGVCPGCRIMVLKIARDSDGAMFVSNEIKAIKYAKSKGAKIINLSLGAPNWSASEREAVRTSGALALVAAGNDSLDNDMAIALNSGAASPSYPASYTLGNILAVAAANDENRYGYSTECFEIVGSRKQCAFTNWGHDSVDLAAPGVDITSSFPVAAGSYETWDGTSMSAPHVSGLAGLVMSHNSALTPVQVKNAIMHGVDKPARLDTMYIAPPINTERTGAFTRTSGRINALTSLTASTTNATALTDGNVDGAKWWTTARKQAAIAWPNDINDVYRRSLSNGHTYRISLTVPAGQDYDLYVWRPTAKEIWEPGVLVAASVHGGATDESVTFKAGRNGTFFVQVSAWLFKHGGYTLHFKRLS